jgi:hypothetical protein
MEFFNSLGGSLLARLPALLAWGAGIVVAVTLLRRGGGRAEKLFLAGSCLMFVSALAGPLLLGVARSSVEPAPFMPSVQMFGLLMLPVSVLGLAGLVCLVWGFWLRFRSRQREAA